MYIGGKTWKEGKWLNLLLEELAQVDTDVERELIQGLINKSRAGLREMEEKARRYLKVLEILEKGGKAKEGLLADEEIAYLKGVRLKRGRKSNAERAHLAGLKNKLSGGDE